MKFLLDQGIPRTTVVHLAALGIAADHVGDLGLSGAADALILKTAREQGLVVVTLDADFHQLLSLARDVSPSVVRIRCEGLRAEQVADILARAVMVAGEDLMAGAAVSITTTRIRVRSLPLGGSVRRK